MALLSAHMGECVGMCHVISSDHVLARDSHIVQ